MNKTIKKALIDQFNYEIHSGHIYLRLAGIADARGYEGASKWFFVQYKEELSHAWRFYKYLTMHDIAPEIEMNKTDPIIIDENTPLVELFEMALHHEKIVTNRIKDIYILARKENDFATEAMLDWFMLEQVEEEDSIDTLIKKIKASTDKDYSLTLDKMLSDRKFDLTMPEDYFEI